jgi:hypothetical protein
MHISTSFSIRRHFSFSSGTQKDELSLARLSRLRLRQTGWLPGCGFTSEAAMETKNAKAGSAIETAYDP